MATLILDRAGLALKPDGKALAKGRARAVIRGGGMQPPPRMFMVS